MSNALTSTLTEVFLDTGIMNPSWNMSSGTVGFDGDTNSAFVTSGTIPSFVGTSLYSIVDSSFSAKIKVAGGSKTQTALIIQLDSNNYVQMGFGPDQQFRGYVSNAKNITFSNNTFPEYDPVQHLYWRIRDQEGKTFFFDTSPDGSNWTNLGYVSYFWDGSSVSVIFFTGAQVEEIGSPFPAFISSINTEASRFILSGTGADQSGGHGSPTSTSPWQLRATGAGNSGGIGIPAIQIIRGGITDFGVWDFPQPDAAMARLLGISQPNAVAGSYVRPWISGTAPSVYRDGSYWPAAYYASVRTFWTNIPDANAQWMTDVQFEENNNFENRIDLNAAAYLNTCAYAPQFSVGGNGSGQVTLSSDRAFSGQYSGKMLFRGATQSPRVIPSGLNVYFPYPTAEALSPIITGETIRGSVWLSMDRVGAQWFPSLIQYNDSGAILSATYLSGTITSLITHPGGGSWQQGTVSAAVTAGATKAAIIPVVVWSGVAADETVYMDNHFLTGITPSVSNVPSAYTSPRTVEISVRADKVNYAMNSGFNANITGWGAYMSGLTGNSASVINTVWDSGVGMGSLGSARVDMTQPDGSTTLSPSSRIGLGSQRVWSGGTYPQIQGLKAGKTYNFSCWVRKGPNCPDIGMSFYDANGVGIFASPSVDNGLMYSQATTDPTKVIGDWVRLESSFTLPVNALPEFQIWVWVFGTDILSNAPFSYWVDSVNVTEGPNAIDHFDGDFGSADYLWEAIRNNSRTHFYKDLTHKRARVDQIVQENISLGGNYNVLYAQPPS